MSEPRTVVHAFTASVAARPDAPLLTYYDDASGERTELSGATLANWVAKTANLLVDGLGLAPGSLAAVRLPPHWQSAAILLGCWAAGLTVSLDGDEPAAVAFVDRGQLQTAVADDVYALALHPFGLPFPPPGPPPGTMDFIPEVRAYGDRLPGPATLPGQTALRDGPTHADLVAARRPLPPRVLIDADTHPDPVTWLVAPLLVGSSVVLCRHLDSTKLSARLATERAEPLPPR